ncbi:MAG TPA: NAD(P)/FAD-dependent oxidoreductase [Candidatus Nanopelagicaceae bacterium]|nr:NAD(P)/FAD-dependent oxidoreductase [Candidatus Nanopelagicaceae bacterium]
MENLQKTFDVIVVGAGTGGSTAARFAAEKGIKVCLIDSKDKKEIGNKICGDAVGSEIFDFLKIKHPRDDELSCKIKGAKLYSPNLKKCIDLTDPKQAGYIVNRIEFGQRLLNEALDAGVELFIDNTMALDLLYSQNKVSGVKVKLENGEKVDLRSKILIDASGFYSPLRKNVKSTLIEKEILKEDSILCYREIVKFSPQDLNITNPDYISIILNRDKAPGGYIWYFPKNQSSLNIGLGTFMNLKGKVKDLYHQYVFNEFIKTSKYEIISSGGGVVPVRRPLWSCTDNGIMFVGDSACQVNPLHGGGIDPSMRGGFYAANTAINAVEKGDYSVKSLWNYNHNVMTSFGAEFASLDLLRMTLQILPNEDLNFALQQDLLSGEEILEISSTGEFELPVLNLVTKALKGISKPNLLLDLNYLRIRMNEISKLYKNFPINIENFEEWKRQAIQVYDKIKKMLIDTKKVK